MSLTQDPYYGRYTYFRGKMSLLTPGMNKIKLTSASKTF